MRPIRSFVLRAGRLSNRQANALHDHLSKYQLTLDDLRGNSLSSVFEREAETIVEIGFGMGKSLLAMAKAHPEINFIGIEVYQAGVGSLIADLEDQAISNVRIVMQDAVEVFRSAFETQTLMGIQIFFPDPWPKKRHQKRRLIQSEFVQLISPFIKSQGILHCATDWEDYALHIQDIMKLESGFVLCQATALRGFPQRITTKYEQRGQRLGHSVWDLIYQKV